MAEQERTGGLKWFKIGCLGCVGLLALGVLAAAAVAGLAALQVRSEKLEDQTQTHGTAVAAVDGADPGVEAPATGRRGNVRIRLTSATFEVLPAGPGEALSVDARYDAASYRMEESFEETDDGWDYDLSFERKGGMLMGVLRQIVGGTTPSVTIRLPLDVEMDLEFEARQTGGTVELGGLWLRRAQVRVVQGGFELGFADPLRAPMEELTIEAGMGGASIERLGNASPRKLDVDCRMGGFALDMRGLWLADSEISILVKQGEVNLRLPDDVIVEGLAGGARGKGLRDAELATPTLRFSTSVGNSGEVTVQD